MALPKAVQAQEDAANALFEGDGGQQAQNWNTSQQAPEPQPAPAPKQEEPAQGPSVIDDPHAQQNAAPAGNTGDLQATVQALEQKLQVLKGKYDHELPRYAGQVRDLREENEQLKKQLEESSAGNDVNQAVDALSEVLDEESIKALQAMIRGEMSTVNKRLESISGDVERTQQTTMTHAQRTFYGTLDAMAPSWNRLNNDPGFKKYIENTARGGKTLSQKIREAFEDLDAPGVAAIFNEYDQKRQSQHSELDEQIMPGQSGGGVNPNQTQARTISDDEYLAANKEVALGRMSAEDFSKLESQYYAQNGIS